MAALLSVNKRKIFFKTLGYEYTPEGVKAFQKTYFEKKASITGKYDKNTDVLLRHCYNVKLYAPHFRPAEFKCECRGKHCNGYPTWMRKNQLVLLENIRTHYGKPITVTCGLRCKGYNRELNGSISNSKHLQGKATDFYQPGTTDTIANRTKTINWIKKQKNFAYAYGDGVNSYGNRISAPYMGNALHVDTEV